MKFWDPSAIVPLLIAEPTSDRLHELFASDPGMLVWWGSEVECASALARAERSQTLGQLIISSAFARLREFVRGWQEIDPSVAVRETATRLLRVHQLRAADALQLAAAFQAAEGRSGLLELITLDDRLALAARKEGFVVIDAEALG